MPTIVDKLKREVDAIKSGEPGHRFQSLYEQRAKGESPSQARWRNISHVIGGLLLVIVGGVLSIPPGLPGFLLWIPGLALLVSRSPRLAFLLDRSECAARGAWVWAKQRVSR
jgi:hypothetical protein